MEALDGHTERFDVAHQRREQLGLGGSSQYGIAEMTLSERLEIAEPLGPQGLMRFADDEELEAEPSNSALAPRSSVVMRSGSMAITHPSCRPATRIRPPRRSGHSRQLSTESVDNSLDNSCPQPPGAGIFWRSANWLIFNQNA